MGFLKRFFRNVFRDGSVPVGTSSFEHLNEEELETHLAVSRYGDFMVQIESVPGVFSSALGDIGYIFRSKSLDDILKIVRFIHQTEDAPG